MVLRSQDAWRRHPLLSGCAKRPFPHLGTAIGIFGFYLFAGWMVDKISTAEEEPEKRKFKYYIKEDGELGLKVRGGGGHH